MVHLGAPKEDTLSQAYARVPGCELRDDIASSKGRVMSEKIDIFEGDKLRVNASITKGDPSKADGKKVKWTFTQTGGQEEIGEKSATMKDGKASISVKAPKVKDDEASYEIRFEKTYEGGKTSGKKYYIVWPKTFELKAVHKVDGSEKPCEKFLFDVLTEKGPKYEALTTDAKGEHHFTCHEKAAHKVVARSPWEIETWKKTGPRKIEVLVKRKKYTAELVNPANAGSPHKQLVNLTNDGTKPRHGSLLKVQVCAKGDLPRAAKDRLGMENDELFIQVIFSAKNSKRDSPKPGLTVDGAAVASEADKRTFKSKLKLKANGDAAECEVELGRAGGDECEIKVGVTDACTDDSAKLVNWRRYKLEMWQPEANTVAGRATKASSIPSATRWGTTWDRCTRTRRLVPCTDSPQPTRSPTFPSRLGFLGAMPTRAWATRACIARPGSAPPNAKPR
jgi:hypothetical protein